MEDRQLQELGPRIKNARGAEWYLRAPRECQCWAEFDVVVHENRRLVHSVRALDPHAMWRAESKKLGMWMQK